VQHALLPRNLSIGTKSRQFLPSQRSTNARVSILPDGSIGDVRSRQERSEQSSCSREQVEESVAAIDHQAVKCWRCRLKAGRQPHGQRPSGTHHISGEQSLTPTSADFGNRVLVGDPLHNSARNGSTIDRFCELIASSCPLRSNCGVSAITYLSVRCRAASDSVSTHGTNDRD
jgi:hypothetical protein